MGEIDKRNSRNLTAASFDAMTSKRKIWGLTAIARHLGISADKARRLARLPEVPIYRPAGAGSYVAFTSELDAWLRTKA